MKKVLVYMLIIVIGTVGVYYGLVKLNEKKDNTPKVTQKKDKKEETVIPSKDSFMEEAIKLQTLAENKNGNNSCKCYKVKDIDPNSKLNGSILVYTVDDLFVSSLWLSNGYYLLNGTENVAVGLIEETSETASIYCGEESASTQSSLCASNY